MLPALAALAWALFVAYLFWTDARRKDEPSISWVPLAWMFLAGSRYASSWLSLGVPFESADAYAEGSPLDRAVFFSLIVAGAFTLARRQIDWAQLLTQNKWIVLYLLYCLASVLWSDEPYILVKRWVKDLGNPIMALVILTEQRPYKAAAMTLRRLAYLLLPLSVLFIRYYPEMGRTYHVDGSSMYTGVGHQKNDLGLMCLITGMYLFWRILRKGETATSQGERGSAEAYVLLLMMGWLLYMSNSQTSLACLITAVIILVVARTPVIGRKPSRIVTVGVLGALSFVVLDATLDLKEFVIVLLGRDPSLTNRTDVWEVLLGMGTNPVLGTGFMSFWAGDRLDTIWQTIGAGINQAHSGYLEQYLNLGYVGLALIGIVMLSGLLQVRRHLNVDAPAAILRLCFIVAAGLYNYTEAAFYGINNMWLLLLLACIDVSGQPQTARQERRPARVDPYSQKLPETRGQM